MKLVRGALIVGSLTLLSACLLGQAAGNGVAANAADAAWQNLQQAVARIQAPATGLQSATDFLGAADQYHAFYTSYPSATAAKDAKCLEGIMLLRAWLAGDTSQSTRRQQVVADVRNDGAVTPVLRAELFALSDSAAIEHRQDFATRDDKLLAYEQATRSLIAAFPTLPNGYEALAAIARDASETKGASLSREILAMPAASKSAKEAAQLILDRLGLEGRSLSAIAIPILGPRSSLSEAAGHSIVVYSWSAGNLGSRLRAKAVVAGAPAGTMALGVCVDVGDPTAAKMIAGTDGLPGELVYDAKGADGALASALKLSDAGYVYIADASGVIRSVSAQNDLRATLAAQ